MFLFRGKLSKIFLQIFGNTSIKMRVLQKKFFAYFHKKEIGYAIEIAQVDIYPIPIDPFWECPSFIPPQFFVYRDKEKCGAYV